jgi:hypothetical protein
LLLVDIQPSIRPPAVSIVPKRRPMTVDDVWVHANHRTLFEISSADRDSARRYYSLKRETERRMQSDSLVNTGVEICKGFNLAPCWTWAREVALLLGFEKFVVHSLQTAWMGEQVVCNCSHDYCCGI